MININEDIQITFITFLIYIYKKYIYFKLNYKII